MLIIQALTQAAWKLPASVFARVQGLHDTCTYILYVNSVLK